MKCPISEGGKKQYGKQYREWFIYSLVWPYGAKNRKFYRKEGTVAMEDTSIILINSGCLKTVEIGDKKEMYVSVKYC